MWQFKESHCINSRFDEASKSHGVFRAGKLDFVSLQTVTILL